MDGITDEEELAAHRHPKWGFFADKEEDPAYVKQLADEILTGKVDGPIVHAPGSDFTREVAVKEQAELDGFDHDRPQHENDLITWLAAEKVYLARIENGTEMAGVEAGGS